MLNIAANIKTDLKGCESYLKSLSDVDSIDGNYKFCDTHTFTARPKIVCSANTMIKVNDASYGMRRKLMFCKFAACFKGKADPRMPAKLENVHKAIAFS